MRFFVALLSGYRRYLVYPTKRDPNPIRLFNEEEFLEKIERDLRPFATALCDTQVSYGARLLCSMQAETQAETQVVIESAFLLESCSLIVCVLP